MSEHANSLPRDLDNGSIETKLHEIEDALASMLERGAGKSDIRDLVVGFAARVQARVNEVFPRPFELNVWRSASTHEGVVISGFPRGTAGIFVPINDLRSYQDYLEAAAKRAKADGLAMVATPDCFRGIASVRVPVAAAIDAAQKLKAFF